MKVFGNIVFPPRAIRSKFNKNLNGPILENCFYSLLLHLKNLEELVIPAAPLVIARLSILLTPVQRDEVKLKLKQLVFGWDERLEANINIFLLIIEIFQARNWDDGDFFIECLKSQL